MRRMRTVISVVSVAAIAALGVTGIAWADAATLGKCQKAISKENQKLEAKMVKALNKCADNYQKAVKKGDPMLWSGPWEILSGTGELENLKGRGTWWETEPTHIIYTGWIRFKDYKHDD